MPYGVDVQAFRRLDVLVRELPPNLESRTPQISGILIAYLDAFSCLLFLMSRLMAIVVERNERRSYVRRFLPIFSDSHERAVQLLRQQFEQQLRQEDPGLQIFVESIRHSNIAPELVVLGEALDESEGHVDPEDHLDTATTITNSVKGQIEQHSWPWVKSVLHTINEIISIVRGVV